MELAELVEARRSCRVCGNVFYTAAATSVCRERFCHIAWVRYAALFGPVDDGDVTWCSDCGWGWPTRLGVRACGSRICTARRRGLVPMAERQYAITVADWAELCSTYGWRCAYCGDQVELVLDHVIPRARGGQDVPANRLPACTTCNRRKGVRLVGEWTADPRRINSVNTPV
jgi:5-methylcytosine-specific restriction endonuclease McrA